LVPIDFSYTTSCRLLIVTFALGLTDDDRRTQHCSISADTATANDEPEFLSSAHLYCGHVAPNRTITVKDVSDYHELIVSLQLATHMNTVPETDHINTTTIVQACDVISGLLFSILKPVSSSLLWIKM